MNKEIIIKLLNECLSSDNKGLNKEKLQVVSRLLEKIKGSASALQELDFDKLKECCQITEDEIQELSFYMIMCQWQDSDYQLTKEQINRIKELIDKYLKEINDKLVLISKNQEKDNYIRMIIEKVSQDRFILSTEELEYINKLFKEKNVEISQINQIMISLSLITIQELERQLKEKDKVEKTEEQVVDGQEVTEELVVVAEKEKDMPSGSKELTKNEYIFKLDDILTKYNYWEIRETLVNDLDNLMKVTTFEDIEYILKTINTSGVKVNLMIVKALIYNSSSEVIKKVLEITTKLSGKDEAWCFKYLCEHVSIFMKEGEKSSYQDFMKNMYMLEELNLTSEEFMLLNVESLCISHKRLKKNVLTLERYKIPRTTYLKSLTVLKTMSNLSDELDIWVELGSYETEAYLENHLSILVTNKINNFKNKLRILKTLGLSITINDKNRSLNKWQLEELDLISSDGSVIIGNKRYYNVQFVPYEVKIPEYDSLMNKKHIELQEDKASENEIYQKFINSVECVNGLYYRIPEIGIRISKNKVYRVFNNLISNGIPAGREMLIYSIVYNSAITEEEYHIICNFVDQVLGNNLEHKGSVR